MQRSLGTWIKMHPVAWTVAIAVIAAAAGWRLGARAACGTGWANCSFDASIFEGTGTWVGAIGTIAAVVYAAAQVRREALRHADDRATAREERLQRQATDLADARACSVRLVPMKPHDGSFTSVDLSFSNNRSQPITDATIYLARRKVAHTELVLPERTWYQPIPLATLGLASLPTEPPDRSGQILNQEVWPDLAVEFSIGIRRFRRKREKTIEIPWSLPVSEEDDSGRVGLATEVATASPEK